MTRKEKAVAGNNGSNTFDFVTGNQKAFSVSDYAESQENLQSNLLALMKPPKVMRTYHCFACEKSFAAKKMSNVLIICKACFSSATTDNKGKVARRNFFDRALSNFHKFLRRRISA
jgi:DNA-directed RNA polymerase subunit RPC12/RpoP